MHQQLIWDSAIKKKCITLKFICIKSQCELDMFSIHQVIGFESLIFLILLWPKNCMNSLNVMNISHPSNIYQMYL